MATVCTARSDGTPAGAASAAEPSPVVLGGGGDGIFEQLMTPLAGIDQQVYAPHWYPDIYPMIGLNQSPREFSAEQVRYRDYSGPLEERMWRAEYTLGNIPVVYGEFGTYYNFSGIETSIADDYLVSAHILDNYYEAFEEMGVGHMQWCFSPINDHRYGDGWNAEDFSVVDPDGVAHPWRRQLCGRLIAMQRRDDGSWVNENAPRWWEGNPVLATSYAMITLSHAMPTKVAEGR